MIGAPEIAADDASPTGVSGLVAATNPPARQAPGPQPGDVYREFARHNGGDSDWRITDDQAVEKFPRARDHLPNAQMPLTIDDLDHAIAAEVLLDRWGGHRGTINKRIRFNGGDWIPIPEIGQNPDYGWVPDGIRPEMLMYQDNPVVSVPLKDLVEGINTLEADCDEAGGFGWGQWGLYSAVVRVYYDASAKGENAAITGRIVSPRTGATIGERPVIEIDADAEMGVSRIDVLAAYDGFDEDGDGVFGGYHGSRFQLTSGEPNELRDHVGTLWKKPYRLTWDARWVPDQPDRSIRLQARIQNSRGYWTVTEPTQEITLSRSDARVVLYRPRDVPEDFAVRVDETKRCWFDIPETDSLADASGAILHLRTWHGWDGHHEPLRINDHELPVDGKNHFYDYDQLSIPPSALRTGENEFAIHSTTEHHMLEVLWPGPAIAVRYRKTENRSDEAPDDQPADNELSIRETPYQDRPQWVVTTPAATYWVDQRSGGLSRLVDPAGKDWIAFQTQPWGDYPAAAASGFRGMPNAVFGGNDGGFGHPGWDVAQTRPVTSGRDSIELQSVSDSGDWKLAWRFTRDHADLVITPPSDQVKYWFLYEGPIAGRWQPDRQFIGTDRFSDSDQIYDYYSGDRRNDLWQWAYLGDRDRDHALVLIHQTADDQADTFSQLGNTENGIASPDGMAVFGFGRGPDGIDPRLTGEHRFRIAIDRVPSEAASVHAAMVASIERLGQPTSTDGSSADVSRP